MSVIARLQLAIPAAFRFTPAILPPYTRRSIWIETEQDAWQKRDLLAKRYVYVWAGGIYLQARLEDEKQRIRRARLL